MSEISKVFAGLDTRLRRFKREYGVELLRRVEEKTPELTGEMKASYAFKEKLTDIEILNFAEHASYVEYGTPKMAPRAPLRRTLLESEEIAEVAAEKAGLKK